MKTLLAIALAAAALTIATATVAPISGTASRAGADPISGADRRPFARRGRHPLGPITGGKLAIDIGRPLHGEVGR